MLRHLYSTGFGGPGSRAWPAPLPFLRRPTDWIFHPIGDPASERDFPSLAATTGNAGFSGGPCVASPAVTMGVAGSSGGSCAAWEVKSRDDCPSRQEYPPHTGWLTPKVVPPAALTAPEAHAGEHRIASGIVTPSPPPAKGGKRGREPIPADSWLDWHLDEVATRLKTGVDDPISESGAASWATWAVAWVPPSSAASADAPSYQTAWSNVPMSDATAQAAWKTSSASPLLAEKAGGALVQSGPPTANFVSTSSPAILESSPSGVLGTSASSQIFAKRYRAPSCNRLDNAKVILKDGGHDVISPGLSTMPSTTPTPAPQATPTKESTLPSEPKPPITPFIPTAESKSLHDVAPGSTQPRQHEREHEGALFQGRPPTLQRPSTAHTSGNALSKRQSRRQDRIPQVVVWEAVTQVCRHRRKWDTEPAYMAKCAAGGGYRALPGLGKVHGGGLGALIRR